MKHIWIAVPKYFNCLSIWIFVNILMGLFMFLEISITIYKPVDAQNDKMVIFFHGGGNHAIIDF